MFEKARPLSFFYILTRCDCIIILLCMVEETKVLCTKLDDLIEELKELHEKLDSQDNRPINFALQQKIYDKSLEIDNLKRLVAS